MLSDDKLIDQIKYGNERAAEELITRYYASILRYCRWHCSSVEKAEDLTQETFYKLFKNISGYKGKRKFKAYLYTIANRLCIDESRKAPFYPLEDEESIVDECNEILRLDDKSEVNYLLSTLSPEQRDAIILRFGEQLEFHEIAKVICKYLLSVIENSTKEHIDVSNLTIEHILPQKENAAVWKKEVGADYGRVYETYLHTLGNLTITGHNSELGTKAFEEKKKIIRQNSKANILNREVLSADTWTEKSILHRAEILADILIEEFKYIEIHSDTNESTELTFDVNSNFDFSNTKPGEMIFVGEHTKVSSWADLLAKTMNTAFDLDAETITDLATKDYSIPYATRIYISNDERKIRKPKQIDNSGIYFEANLSANGIISFIKDLLAKLQLDTDDFSFSLSEVPFDIDNEDTWAEGLIPVAKLFYNFVENLVEKELIDSAELENLKTKEYTKNLFQATDYPAIANSRTDNMGNSLQKRYRAKAINFNGSEIYVSTQFFDSDRDAVIDWYRSHL